MRDGAVIYQEKGPLVAAHGLPGLAQQALAEHNTKLPGKPLSEHSVLLHQLGKRKRASKKVQFNNKGVCAARLHFSKML